MKTSIVALAVSLLVPHAAALAQDSTSNSKSVTASGTWRMEFDWEGTEVKDAFQLQQEGKKLTGTLHRNDTKLKIENGKVEDGKMSFTVTAEYQGNEFTTKYSGKIDGDELDGTAVIEANGQEYELPWKPKRSVKMEDLVGTWKLTIDAPDGNTYTPTLKIAKKGDDFVHEYGSQFGNLELKEFRIDDNDLCFTIDTEYDGAEMKLDYRARAHGNDLKGVIDYDLSGNTGETSFVGKREKAKKE